MRNNFKFAALTLAAAIAAAPVMAQTGAAAHSTAMTPATSTMGGVAATTPATTPTERNPVLTQTGDTRASKVIGSSVYNDHDEKLGAVDDLLIGKGGKLNAVLSVGGAVGVGAKYVEVPYASLTFGNTQNNSDNRVVLKGATKDSLKAQTAYAYVKA